VVFKDEVRVYLMLLMTAAVNCCVDANPPKSLVLVCPSLRTL